MDERHICTKDDPYDAAQHERAAHPDSVLIRSDSDNVDGSEWEVRKCPHCGVQFTMEIPR
jgi:hypothetical protein